MTKDERVKYMCIALGFAGCCVTEACADLIIHTNDYLNKAKGNGDLKTMCQIREAIDKKYSKTKKNK